MFWLIGSAMAADWQFHTRPDEMGGPTTYVAILPAEAPYSLVGVDLLPGLGMSCKLGGPVEAVLVDLKTPATVPAGETLAPMRSRLDDLPAEPGFMGFLDARHALAVLPFEPDAVASAKTFRLAWAPEVTGLEVVARWDVSGMAFALARLRMNCVDDGLAH